MSENKSNIKSRLPSRHVSVGPKSAPHRSMYYAMDMKRKSINHLLELQQLGMNPLLAISL